MPIVYQATNTVDGKRYIGVSRKSIDYRSKYKTFKYMTEAVVVSQRERSNVAP